MALKISKPFWQAISLGTLAGMRSMSAPAITSHILSHHHSKNLEGTPLNFIQSEKVATVLKVLAVSELLGDKIPSAPNRIKATALVSRCVAGALSGASIYKAAGENAITGGLLGGASAIASTFVSFFARKTTVKRSHLIDPVVGIIEDALVFGSAAGLATAA
ncbi:DUF4126 family protein [Mucilaginibacter sp. KACC 22063]|uniref:DUF4126 family protein n=1 Tax=Mucilaginibacter sp. KACC 22063 TaxID=3025666 RepID=UPI00236505DD|nr:DUF4126 family protein [Mucilaginibacter sp. KACC 22063]WDF53642.1 DUF4126 family protein [Mucilaginibacter sp. KACC 22063]